jgi:hypothetical protein
MRSKSRAEEEDYHFVVLAPALGHQGVPVLPKEEEGLLPPRLDGGHSIVLLLHILLYVVQQKEDMLAISKLS